MTHYHIFVLHKDKKYIEEVIAYLQSENKRPYSQERDFMDEQGILSAPLSSEEAMVLKLKFPQVSLHSEHELQEMIIESLRRTNSEVLEQIRKDPKYNKS